MNSLLNIIKTEAVEIETVMRADLADASLGLDSLLFEVLEYGIFNGGKRLRPLLLLLSSRICGSNNKDDYKLAIAFEYLHIASLMHDDLIDRASMRRGKPSLHKAFGKTEAILAGDFLLARSMELVGEYGGVEALKIFCRSCAGMVNGEFVQLRNIVDFNQTDDDYLAAIRGKTALLISATCEIGAIAGKGSEKERSALQQYGTFLGYAFQMVDDLLDYLGDSAATGKAVGNDFLEGKMTLPIIAATDRAAEADKERIIKMISAPEKDIDDLAKFSELVQKNNGFSYTKKRAEQCIGEALQLLEIFTSAKALEAKEILAGISKYVISRKA